MTDEACDSLWVGGVTPEGADIPRANPQSENYISERQFYVNEPWFYVCSLRDNYYILFFNFLKFSLNVQLC